MKVWKDSIWVWFDCPITSGFIAPVAPVAGAISLPADTNKARGPDTSRGVRRPEFRRAHLPCQYNNNNKKSKIAKLQNRRDDQWKSRVRNPAARRALGPIHAPRVRVVNHLVILETHSAGPARGCRWRGRPDGSGGGSRSRPGSRAGRSCGPTGPGPGPPGGLGAPERREALRRRRPSARRSEGKEERAWSNREKDALLGHF